jgi:transketolase
MRKQFVLTIERLISDDENLAILLGDIGVFGFRNVFQKYPERIYNIGICEQAMTSIAAGMAKEGLHPVMHSIAPFVIERCFEQLKIDVGFQKHPVNIVSVGASYDYAALGSTHHCPGDVALVKTINGINIIVPGSDKDFDLLFSDIYKGPTANYFRLTEKGHSLDFSVTFGKANLIKSGKKGIVIAIGPMLERVITACLNLDVSILYYTTLEPFDSAMLIKCFVNSKVAVVEPFYEGTMSYDIHSALKGHSINLLSIGVPRKFLSKYGVASEQDILCGLDTQSIKSKLEIFFGNEK